MKNITKPAAKTWESSAGQENLDLFLESKVSWFGCRIDKLSADEEYIETTIKGYVRLLQT